MKWLFFIPPLFAERGNLISTQDMKMKNKIIFIIILAFSNAAYAYDMKNIAAYPVPFNPQKKVLTIGTPGQTSSPHTIRMEIYDINGDLVIKKSGSQIPFVWNGRNSSGRYVKPGLYLLKIEIDDENGDYGKKVVRILVDY